VIRPVEVRVQLQETDMLSYLASLIRKLGVADRYLKLVSELEFDPLRIDIAYVKTLVCDVLCPYRFKGSCILLDVVDYLVARKLVEDLKTAHGVVAWLLDKFSATLGFNLDKVENIRNFTQDVYRYIAVVGPYLEALVEGKKTIEQVDVEVGDRKYRFRCLVVKLSTQDKKPFIVALFQDLEPDLLVLRVVNMFAEAVTEYCTLRELLTLSVIAKEKLAPVIEREQRGS